MKTPTPATTGPTGPTLSTAYQDQGPMVFDAETGTWRPAYASGIGNTKYNQGGYWFDQGGEGAGAGPGDGGY